MTRLFIMFSDIFIVVGLAWVRAAARRYRDRARELPMLFSYYDHDSGQPGVAADFLVIP